MTYSACDFMDDVLNDVAPFIPKRQWAKLGEDDRVEDCYNAFERAFDKIKNERHTAREALKAERLRSARLQRRLRALFQWTDGNVAYFGETADTRRFIRDIDAP